MLVLLGVLAARAAAAPATAPGTLPGDYNRITHTFTQGETLLDALLAVRGSLSPMADLKDASILRAAGSNVRWVNLEAALANPETSPAREILLQPFDRIVIPPSRFLVFITGAVGSPGVLPYTPDKTYRYYLALAGSPQPDSDAEAVTVTDSSGNRRDPEAYVQPQDTITITRSQVTVWGAVVAPGNYPYRPGQTAGYYIGLAGGIDAAKSGNGEYMVTDPLGKARGRNDPVRPGDRVHVLDNNFLYTFNEYFPLFSSAVALVAAIATITQVVVTLIPK